LLVWLFYKYLSNPATNLIFAFIILCKTVKGGLLRTYDMNCMLILNCWLRKRG